MAISAIGLRNSADCCKPSKNHSVSFAQNEENSASSKKTKTIALVGGLVALAGLATAAYIFRGKIADTKIYKAVEKAGQQFVEKTKDLGTKSLEKLKEFKDMTAQKAADLKTKLKPEAAKVWENITEQANKLYEQMKNTVSKK